MAKLEVEWNLRLREPEEIGNIYVQIDKIVTCGGCWENVSI